MQHGVTGKEDISFTREDFAGEGSTQLGVAGLTFATEAVGGEGSIDLTNLTPPSSMVANGFSNPSSAQISAASILFFRKNLRLYSSIRGRLHDYDGYVVTSSTRISFIGFTLSPGEIIKGEVYDSPRTGTVLSDMRYYRVTYELPVGQTVVPLGVTFKVNQNSTMQGSNIRVFRNGKRMIRNESNAVASPTANGNYQEIDSGNGYGTSIQMNTAPSGPTTDVIDVDIGLYSSDGSAEIFSSLERLAGIVNVLATDLSQATGNPVTNYLTASLSEIDRATYAAAVLSNTARIVETEAIRNTYISQVSSQKTPAGSNQYMAMTGNSVTIPAGQEWELTGGIIFGDNGTSAGWTIWWGYWFAANGADSGVQPTTLGSSVLAGVAGVQSATSSATAATTLLNASTIRVSGGVTVYLVPFAVMSTPANARVTTNIYAKRIK